ncbi:sigma-70 family RNA polymerase sigma factor [Acidaminobacter sp. JC074]|uniref:sigma-70 family RNA polymerase sigma factor n=1 Tax=Acidaminobacter sp. JC074 TaxID=2530199 RepID=UPI001F111D0B|nr:sigma-70 family RNA polymerase sigma factor [Acidaminobacter sp. JC074]MCH4887079.1 sigma-70 family RNA polymerase sigma factor [Acidaminobacter sp. JC074]
MKIIEKAIIEKQEMYYRIAFKYLNNHEDTLDALQETAYKAIKNSNKLKNKDYASTWITRILINTCFDMLRKKKQYEWVELDERIGKTYDLDSKLEVSEMIMKIKTKYRDVIVMKYLEGYKIKEIAEIFNKPEATIKTWLSRGLKSLKGEVADE